MKTHTEVIVENQSLEAVRSVKGAVAQIHNEAKRDAALAALDKVVEIISEDVEEVPAPTAPVPAAPIETTGGEAGPTDPVANPNT